jgi:hypothetical protein
MKPVGEHDQLGRLQLASRDRAQRKFNSKPVATDDRPSAADVIAEASDHLGQPIERVGVVGAIFRIAVKWKVWQYNAVAVLKLFDQRFKLAVAEQLRVPKDQRRPGPLLTVRDAGAVAVVVEPQSHRRRL